MIPSIVKTPISLAQQLAGVAVRAGLGGATALLHRVTPGGDVSSQARSRTETPKPTVSAEPVRQPAAPKAQPVRGATTTLADPAPATASPATRKATQRATPRPGAAKKSPASGRGPEVPKKSAATLNEPAAPVDDDPVVYSSGPDA